MVDWLFYSLTTMLCLLSSLLLRARARSPSHSATQTPPLPPGPVPLPVLGPLLHLARRDFDLEPVLRRLARAYGPVYSFAPLGLARPMIFVAARGPAHRALVQRGAASPRARRRRPSPPRRRGCAARARVAGDSPPPPVAGAPPPSSPAGDPAADLVLSLRPPASFLSPVAGPSTSSSCVAPDPDPHCRG